MSKKSATPAAPVVLAHDITTLLAPTKPEVVAPWDTFKVVKEAAFQYALANPAPTKPKAAAASDAVEADTEDATDDVKSKAAKLSDFGIEDARVRRHLDKFGLNAAVTARVAALKAKYKPAEAAADDKEPAADAPKVKAPKIVMSAADEEIKAAALRARVRIGNGVPAYVRGYCEEIINDLAHVAIEAAICAKRKIVHDSHIFANDSFYLQSSKFRALFECLPSFVEARDKYARVARAVATANIARSYVTDLSRYIDGPNGQARYTATREHLATFAAETAKEEDAEDAASSTTAGGKDARFVFYIRKMLKTVRDSNERFHNLRFSKHLIPLLDNIITEFIMLVAMRALIHINISGAETVSEPVVHSIILGMMATPAALREREIAPEMVRETVTKTKTVGEGAEKHTVEETKEILVASISNPKFISFIEGIYPPSVRAPKPAPVVDEAPAAPAPAPVVEPVKTKPAPKEKPKVAEPAAPAPVVVAAPVTPVKAKAPAKEKPAATPVFTKGAK